jgi:hypothetical protein
MKQTFFNLGLCFFIFLAGCSSKQQEAVSDETSGNTAVSTGMPLQEKASTTYLFTGNDPDVFSVNLLLKGHSLKQGEQVDAVNAANARVRFVIEKITVGSEQKQELMTGETGFIDMKRLEGNVSDLNGDFYFVDPGAAFPPGSADEVVSSASTAPGSISLMLNGKPWTGDITYQGALFYKGGVKMMDPSGKPYMQLAFRANKTPDSRQFTITIKNFSGATGAVSQEGMEVLLSGSETGDSKNPQMIGYKNDSNHAGYSVNLVITKWDMSSTDVAIMSATFSAKLKGVLGSPDATVADGKLENIEVKVFTDRY